MTEPIDLDDRRARRPGPLRVRNLSDLEGKPIPERDWLIPSVLIRRSITLFAGDGGTGKSLMCQQLQVAAALGIDWMGLPIPQPITSFGFYCEDDDDELDRRFASICAHYGASFSDVRENVRYMSRVGESNELVRFKGRGDDASPIRTSLFGQIEEEVDMWGVQLCIIDTAADTFLGNENVRPQVRAFINIIRRLALINNGGVILTAHPSKSAMIDGSGFSGSTAWNGSVRNRLYLTHQRHKPIGDDEDGGPTDDRVLRIMKSNYGPFGEKIKCRWERGVFIRTDGVASVGQLDRLEARRIVLEIAADLVGRGAYLSAHHEAPQSLAKAVSKEPRAKAISFSLTKATIDGLIKEDKLQIIDVRGPSGRLRKYVRPASIRYAGEETFLPDDAGNRE